MTIQRRLAVIACGIALAGEAARAGTTWDGGGGTANWSDPLNWNPDGVPPPLSDLRLGGTVRVQSVQDLGDPFEINSLSFTHGHSIFRPSGGSSLRILSSISATTTGNHHVVLPVELPFGGTIATPPSPGAGMGAVLYLQELSGAGPLTVSGSVGLLGTMFGGPINATGRLVVFNAAQQDNWVVDGEFFGGGAIAMRPGKRITVNGQFEPGDGGLPADVATIDLTGDLEINGTYACEAYLGIQGMPHDRVDVSGTLDLNGPDTFSVFIGSGVGSVVVATYGNRLGEFDNVVGPPGTRLTYTSPANAGPGEIILTIPEPAAATGAAVLALAFLCSRTHGARGARRPAAGNFNDRRACCVA